MPSYSIIQENIQRINVLRLFLTLKSLVVHSSWRKGEYYLLTRWKFFVTNKCLKGFCIVYSVMRRISFHQKNARQIMFVWLKHWLQFSKYSQRIHQYNHNGHTFLNQSHFKKTCHEDRKINFCSIIGHQFNIWILFQPGCQTVQASLNAPFRKISNSAQCGRFALILWRLVKGSFFSVF